MKKNTRFYSLITASVFFLASCVGNKKMTEARARLTSIKENQATETKRVGTINETGVSKLADNKIDSTISKLVAVRIGKLNHKLDSVNGKISRIDSLMLSKRDFRKAYKKEIVPGLQLLDSFRMKNGGRMRVYKMLEDGLDVSNYTLFDLAAFFGPGKYAIPPEQADSAASAFTPLVDSVLSFSSRYSELPQTATLIILGFADGTGFDPQSELYTTLTGLMGKTEATKEELNQMLSELRAKTLQEHLEKQFIKRSGHIVNPEKFVVEYLGQGRGEAYPLASIKDYMVEDARRRIVLCYWSVLPDL